MQKRINTKASSGPFPSLPLSLPNLPSPSRALAFVPAFVRVGAAVATNASVPTQRLRPPPNAPVLPARRGLAFNDNPLIPALGSTPRTNIVAPLSNAGLGVGLAADNRYRHSNVARQKISAANKGNIPWNKGRKHSEETKQKISQATKAAMGTPEIRAKLRFHATGRKHSEETKRKIRSSTRKKRAGNAGLYSKSQRRTPVPFVFKSEALSLLDSRISKRYRAETSEANGSFAGRPKRPMPESTKRKLSERIRALWAEDGDYRDRVRLGIESRKEKSGRSSLTDTHRANISKTLKEKHAARRKEMGLPFSSKPRARRPRKVTPGNDPAVGTRFSEAFLTPEAKLARDERRELTRKLLDDAEEVEKESNTRKARESAQMKRAAEEKELAKIRKEAREAQNNDRILIESLALAGQLPSLEEECAMVGSTFQFGSSTQTELPFMQTAGFDSTDALFLDPVESLPDPLVDDPMASTTAATATTALFESSSSSNAFGGSLFTANPFPLMAEKAASTASTTSKKKKRRKKSLDDDEVLSMPFMGNEAVFAEEAEDDDDDDDELEEPVSMSNSSVQDSSALKGTVIKDDLAGEVSATGDLESIIFGSPNRKVYRYVNGERVLQTLRNS